MASNSDNLDGALLLGFIGGIVTFVKGFRVYSRYRLVEDTPAIPIRSVAMGLVRVEGKAQSENLVNSPVTHTPCCFYKVDIEQWKTEGESGGSWRHFCTDADGPKFYLEDASSHVLVDAHKADCDLEKSCVREVHGGRIASAASVGATDAELLSYVTRASTSKFLGFAGRGIEALASHADPEKRQGMLAMGELLQHPFDGSAGPLQAIMAAQMARVQQKLQAKGPQADPQHEQARLAILEATKHPIGSPEFVEAVRRVSQMEGKPIDEMKLQHGLEFMVNGRSLDEGLPAASGRYRLTEYCILPGHEYNITGTCVENPEPKDQHDRNLITKGLNELTFLISWKAPRVVESGLRNRSIRMIFGGAAVTIICLAILLAKFGLL